MFGQIWKALMYWQLTGTTERYLPLNKRGLGCFLWNWLLHGKGFKGFFFFFFLETTMVCAFFFIIKKMHKTIVVSTKKTLNRLPCGDITSTWDLSLSLFFSFLIIGGSQDAIDSLILALKLSFPVLQRSDNYSKEQQEGVWDCSAAYINNQKNRTGWALDRIRNETLLG